MKEIFYLYNSNSSIWYISRHLKFNIDKVNNIVKIIVFKKILRLLIIIISIF